MEIRRGPLVSTLSTGLLRAKRIFGLPSAADSAMCLGRRRSRRDSTWRGHDVFRADLAHGWCCHRRRWRRRSGNGRAARRRPAAYQRSGPERCSPRSAESLCTGADGVDDDWVLVLLDESWSKGERRKVCKRWYSGWSAVSVDGFAAADDAGGASVGAAEAVGGSSGRTSFGVSFEGARLFESPAM